MNPVKIMLNNLVCLPICLLFSFSFFISSCKGQVKKAPGKESTAQSGNFTWGAENNPLDRDPYFIENKDSVSAYGHRGITRNIIQDKNGNIWFASYTGIVQLKDNKFTNFTNIAGLRRYRIFSVFEDKAGNIWFGTVGAGVYRYNGNSFANYTMRHGLVDNKVECITEDKAGNIWFGTGSGVSYLPAQLNDKEGKGIKFRSFDSEDGLVDPDVHAIIQDKAGKIWVGSLGGVFFYDEANQVTGQPAFTAFYRSEGKTFKNVRSIIEDKKGNLWFGGQDGLFKYDKQSVKNYTTNFTGNLYEDKAGAIWFSANAGVNKSQMQLYRYPGEKMPPLVSDPNISLIKNEDGQIFGITEDSKGNIWYGTLGGACRYDGKTFEYFRREKAN